MNRYDRYPGDYLRATLVLSLAQDGAYTRLLDWYYSTEKPIDDATKFAVTRCASEADREITQWVLDRFFEFEPSNGGQWIHARAEQEIAKAAPRIAAAKNNGKRGGRPSRANPVGNPVGYPEPNPAVTHTGEGEGEGSLVFGVGVFPAVTDPPPSGVRESAPPPALVVTQLQVDAEAALHGGGQRLNVRERRGCDARDWTEVRVVLAAGADRSAPRTDSDSRVQLVLSRFSEGFTPEELCDVVLRSKRDAFWSGKPWQFVLKDPGGWDRIGTEPTPVVRPTVSDQRFAEREELRAEAKRLREQELEDARKAAEAKQRQELPPWVERPQVELRKAAAQ